MTWLWTIAGLAAAAAFMGWRFRRRALTWAAEVRAGGLPWRHIVVHPAAPASQSFDVTLFDTDRPHIVDSIMIDVADLEAIGLETPPGFVRSEAREAERDDGDPPRRIWVPSAPLVLAPGQPHTFTLHVRADAMRPVTVTIGLTVPMKVGGGAMGINLPVPLRDPRAVEVFHEKQEFGRRGRDLNVMPNTLPGWHELRAREQALQAEGLLL